MNFSVVLATSTAEDGQSSTTAGERRAVIGPVEHIHKHKNTVDLDYISLQ